MVVLVKCIICGKEHAIVVPRDGYMRWLQGELIQDAMPNVPPEERELLISGICCW